MMQERQNTGPTAVGSTTVPPKKSLLSPIILGIAGILGLSVIGIAGLGAAYYFGVFGGSGGGVSNVNASSKTPTPGSSPVTAPKVEMAMIPGGSFRMGRNDGRNEERPEHPVTVKQFWMDKTEVTNGDYYAFVSATGYRPVPADGITVAISRSMYAHAGRSLMSHPPSTPSMIGREPFAIVTQPCAGPPLYCSTHDARLASVTVPRTVTRPLTTSHCRGLVITAVGAVLSTVTTTAASARPWRNC